MSELSKKAARYGANALPVYRVHRANKTANALSSKMADPRERTWGFAARVFADAMTDTLDGVLARYAGPTRLGGWLDQLSDKYWYLRITKQLVENGELPAENYSVPLVRDIGVTALRPIAEQFGLSADAKQSGKLKMRFQVAAVIASCSPLAYEHPEFVQGLHAVAMGASVVSGVETLSGYMADIREQHHDEPVINFLGAVLDETLLPAA